MPKHWNAEQYDTSHHYVTDLGASLVDLLDPQAGEHILDLGCGTGHLTDEIARRGAVVTGLDSSPAMIERAAATYPPLTFVVADIIGYRSPQPFDAVFSNAVLHWVRPPEGAVETIAGVLRRGGRFVAELGGKGNIQQVCDAIAAVLGRAAFESRHQWYYPSIGEYAALLERHGLEVRIAALFDRPTRVPSLEQWLDMFATPFDLTPEQSAEVEHRLRPNLYRDGEWWVDYRRLRLSAVRL